MGAVRIFVLFVSVVHILTDRRDGKEKPEVN